MRAKIIFCYLFTVNTIVFGQTDTINQYDSNGEKHGLWIVYLDENWVKITDSSQACYTRYADFIHGGNLYPMASWGKEGYKLTRNGVEVTCEKGNAELLDGEYKWYDQKGTLLSTHILKNGMYVMYEYYYPSGQVEGRYAYTEQCGATEQDYCLYLFKKNGSVKVKGPIPRDANGKPLNKE